MGMIVINCFLKGEIYKFLSAMNILIECHKQL
jgi:hypothetical protein